MKTLFISDLHLTESDPHIAQLFLAFLEKVNTQNDVDALYILGDLFEVWIGDDDNSSFNQRMLTALKKVTQRGLPIYLLHGNRDFLIGKKFLKQTGCVLLPEESIVNLYGTPTLLMHGDTLCTSDIAYMRFRKKVRSWWCQKIFLWKSLAKRRAIAEKMRTQSKAYMRTAPDHIMDVTQADVERVMTQYRVKLLIHGHTHRPNKHYFPIAEQAVTRIVLGAWHEGISVLICDNTGATELATSSDAVHYQSQGKDITWV